MLAPTTIERLRRVARLATPIVLLAVVVLSWVPGEERPHTGLAGRYEHLLAYLLTAAGIAVGFPGRTGRICLGLAALAGALEVGQVWVPGRTSQAADFLASAAGALVGAVLAHLALNRRVR